MRYTAKSHSGAIANYYQHKSELYIAVLAVCNESLWLAFSAIFLFSNAHSISYLACFSPHIEILWNWSRLLCSYNLTIIHLPATCDIVAGFTDLFTRCPATLRKSMQERLGAHRMVDTPLISLHGLVTMRIQDMMSILQRFMLWFDSRRLDSAEVRTAWKTFAAKETTGFPAIPQLSARLATGTAYYDIESKEWEQSRGGVIPMEVEGTMRVPIDPAVAEGNMPIFARLVHTHKENNKAQGGRARAPAYVPTNFPGLWRENFPTLKIWQDTGATLEEIQQILNCILPKLSKSQLSYLQKKCVFCKKISKNMRAPFCNINGILFKRVELNYRLLWPEQATGDLLDLMHRQNLVYHLHKDKLQSRMAEYFHVFNFSKHYATMVAACEFCHMHTRVRLYLKLPLGQILNIHNPGDAWSADFVVIHSKLDLSSALVLSDIASNYIVAIPLSDKATTKQIVAALSQHILAPFGEFLCLGTDAQSSFTSEMMSEICAIMRVRRFIVSNPMQSSAERAHKYILWMTAAL